jgi:pyrroloquinoline-quinone synthase
MEKDLTTKLDGVIEHYNLLKHPFYVRWNMGQLTQEELRVYAKEYFHFVRAIPTLVSSIHSNCKDQPSRLSILENLVEEETGGEGLIPHEELWVWFAKGIGVEKEELYDDAASAATKKLLLTYKNLCSASFCAVGAAAMYAYESRIPQIAESKMIGLKQFYNIDDENSLRFFREHMLVDIEHSKTWAELISKLAETPEQRAQVEEATEKAAKALWGMLDGVCEQCGIAIEN